MWERVRSGPIVQKPDREIPQHIWHTSDIKKVRELVQKISTITYYQAMNMTQKWVMRILGINHPDILKEKGNDPKEQMQTVLDEYTNKLLEILNNGKVISVQHYNWLNTLANNQKHQERIPWIVTIIQDFLKMYVLKVPQFKGQPLVYRLSVRENEKAS